MSDNIIEMNCPKCNEPIAFSPSDAGSRGKCPYCDEHFIIPSANSKLQSIRMVSASELPRDSVSRVSSRHAKFYTLSSPDEYRNFAWRRWSARIIDFFCSYFLFFVFLIPFMFLLGFIFSLFHVSAYSFLHLDNPPVQQLFLLFLCVIFVLLLPCISYSLFGTTLGKRLCGLVVCDHDGVRPSFSQFLKRELRIWVKGCWLTLPPLSFIPFCFLHYRKCSIGLPTSYDINHRFQCHPLRGKIRSDFFIVFVACASCYLFKYNFIDDWLERVITYSYTASSDSTSHHRYLTPEKDVLLRRFLSVPFDQLSIQDKEYAMHLLDQEYGKNDLSRMSIDELKFALKYYEFIESNHK